MSAAYWGFKKQVQHIQLAMVQHVAEMTLSDMVITHEIVYGGPDIPGTRDVLPNHIIFNVIAAPEQAYEPEPQAIPKPEPLPIVPEMEILAKTADLVPSEVCPNSGDLVINSEVWPESDPVSEAQQMRQAAITRAKMGGYLR